ncbi:excinuclease ABC subunit C [Tannerella sp. oral taxon BU063 isolate Cell 6/7/9]|uniref:UvrABC system protein C n=1 Tax=Tannerella sp. oral taxon BU063 isolate Cell 6/7/9 TaxID=1411021 RepID=W2CQV4_9BACT|nr:excinuclease ABC subunit C [Tannerella sp. oral taxon BU063 isolate Cell 6/7/9]
MNDRLNYITSLLSTIPEKPGCYQYYDAKGTVIYVGKAKNLRKRISSYFQKEHENRKTRVLVKQIYDLRYIVVDSEADALLLENNLIKQYRPRYNVLLKDDKTYPSIVIKNEPFPRIFQTRNIIRDGSLYYGPYSSVHFIRTLLHLIKELYPIRNCKHALTPEAIGSGKYKVCLQYHIKRCKAPCVGMQLAEEYNRNIADIKEILKGNSSKVSELLLERMKVLAEEMRFEEAQEVKRQYDLVESFRLKSTVVPMLHNVDVFSLDENETSFFINYMHVGSGAIVQVYTIEYQKKLDDEQKEYVLGLGIVEMRERFRSHANEIIVPFIPEGVFPEGISFTVPQRGDKRKLLELSLQNAKQYKVDKLKRSEKFNPEQRATRLLTTIQKDLHLPVLPMQIECFDNSNIQGTNPVAACVVFKKAKPSKKDYRHFHIKTVVGPDDFASMREIVTRRYTRLLEEKAPLPQLIIIDGGKGQLNAATEVLRELNLLGKITIVGLAKRLEEIFYPGDPFPLVLDKTSETLKVIQHLRDEAHRFGITFHRHMRSKGQIVSELDTIKGIGEKTKEALLKKYKSVKRIREVPSAELEELIGKKKATLVAEGLGMEVR